MAGAVGLLLLVFSAGYAKRVSGQGASSPISLVASQAESVLASSNSGAGLSEDSDVPTSDGNSASLSIPDIAGLTEEGARSLLAQSGLKAEVTQEHSSEVASGQVLTQSPVAGESIEPGGNVTFVVSAGPAEEELEPGAPIPNFTPRKGERFSISVPEGWRAESRMKSGRTITTYTSPEQDEARIDASPTAPPSVMSTPNELKGLFEKSPYRLYKHIGLSRTEFAGEPAAMWEFELQKRPTKTAPWSEAMRNRIYYMNRGGGIALVLVAKSDRWASIEPVLRDIEKSFRILDKPSKAERAKGDTARERVMTEEDLQGKSAFELSLMRNEIYARKGLIFSKPELRSHFEGQNWYRAAEPDQVKVHEMLSDVEKANVNIIFTYEKKQGFLK